MRAGAWTLLLAVALVVLVSWGQAGASERLELSLDEAIELAVQQNGALKAAEAREMGAVAREGQARSLMLPSVSASGSYTRLDERPYMDASGFTGIFDPLMEPFEYLVEQGYLDPSTLEGLQASGGSDKIYMGDDDVYSIGVTVQQILFAGGAVWNGYKAAEAAAEAASRLTERERHETVYRATEAYLNLLRAQAGFDVTEDAVSQVEAHLDDLEAMFEEGMLLESEILRARVQMSKVRLQRNEAEHAVQLAGAALAYELGLPVDTEIVPSDELAPVGLPELGLEEWTRRGLEARPDLMAAEAGVSAAARGVAAARGEYLPSVVVVGNYNWDRPDRSYEPEFYDHWSVTVALEMNVFDWGGRGNRIREAKAARLEAEEMAEMAEDGVRLDVRSRYLARDEARLAVDIARDGAEQARESLRVTREAFRSGAATNADVLDAQTALTTAEMDLVNARAQLRLAEAGLMLATGGINR
jgi:outer membrane protein TolC